MCILETKQNDKCFKANMADHDLRLRRWVVGMAVFGLGMVWMVMTLAIPSNRSLMDGTLDVTYRPVAGSVGDVPCTYIFWPTDVSKRGISKAYESPCPAHPPGDFSVEDPHLKTPAWILIDRVKDTDKYMDLYVTEFPKVVSEQTGRAYTRQEVFSIISVTFVPAILSFICFLENGSNSKTMLHGLLSMCPFSILMLIVILSAVEEPLGTTRSECTGSCAAYERFDYAFGYAAHCLAAIVGVAICSAIKSRVATMTNYNFTAHGLFSFFQTVNAVSMLIMMKDDDRPPHSALNVSVSLAVISFVASLAYTLFVFIDSRRNIAMSVHNFQRNQYYGDDVREVRGLDLGHRQSIDSTTMEQAVLNEPPIQRIDFKDV